VLVLEVADVGCRCSNRAGVGQGQLNRMIANEHRIEVANDHDRTVQFKGVRHHSNEFERLELKVRPVRVKVLPQAPN
jgi:hypothetical protein